MTPKALPLNSLVWEFFSTSFEGVDDIQTSCKGKSTKVRPEDPGWGCHRPGLPCMKPLLSVSQRGLRYAEMYWEVVHGFQITSSLKTTRKKKQTVLKAKTQTPYVINTSLSCERVFLQPECGIWPCAPSPGSGAHDLLCGDPYLKLIFASTSRQWVRAKQNTDGRFGAEPGRWY